MCYDVSRLVLRVLLKDKETFKYINDGINGYTAKMTSKYQLSQEEKNGHNYTHEKHGMSLPLRTMAIGSLGLPASGKDTMFDCLAAIKARGVHIVKISMSDLIHAHWNEQTGLGKWLIDPNYIAQTGGLQPPVICTEIMYRNMCAQTSKLLTMDDDDILCFAVSGFPRDLDQAKAALRFPKNQFACFHMDIDEQEAKRRLATRNTLTPRAYDMKPDGRFDNFRRNTMPCIEFLRKKRGHDFHTILGSQGPVEQMELIISNLPLLNAAQREEMRLCLVTEDHPARKVLEKTGCRLPPCTLQWEPRGEQDEIVLPKTNQPWLQRNHSASIHGARVMA